MYRYKPKTSFSGYKIGLKNDNTYIGIPRKYFRKGKALPVQFDGKTKFYSQKESVTERLFDDIIDPSKTYLLLYFLWEKAKKKN